MNPDGFLQEKGIRLSPERPEILHEIRIEIGRSRSGAGFFPGNIPRPLLEKKGEKCEIAHPFNTPYAFTPKPLGIRYMLYSDKRGKMYMENEDQQIFELDEHRNPQLIPNKTVLDGILTRKLVRGGDELSNNGEAQGRLTFVIMDATLVRESEVFRFELEERMEHVKRLIMEPRRLAIAPISINGPAAFDIDMARYEPLSYREYLDPSFKKEYEYNIGSFLFKPTNEQYHYGYHYGCQKDNQVLEWDTNSCQELTFRLTTDEGQTTGHLLAIGLDGKEVKAGNIDLTDDLKTMGGAIIECEKVDGRWLFVRMRNDREHPNVYLSKLGDIETPASIEYLRDVLRSYYN